MSSRRTIGKAKKAESDDIQRLDKMLCNKYGYKCAEQRENLLVKQGHSARIFLTQIVTKYVTKYSISNKGK